MLTCPGGQASVGEQQNVASIITEPLTSARIVKLYDLAFHQFWVNVVYIVKLIIL